jgi:hypothetical protein
MRSKKRHDAADRVDDVDTRIEAVKRTAAALSDGQARSHVSRDCPPHIDEQFWQRLIAAECAMEEQPFDVLVRTGMTLPPPGALDEGQVTVKLWEVIHGMALMGMYLWSTDHLSDRDLYARLWSDTLREPTALQPEDRDCAWHIDLIGGGSEEDVALYLKYYADEDQRRSWADEWPDDPLPDVGYLPFDRDRHLPRP